MILEKLLRGLQSGWEKGDAIEKAACHLSQALQRLKVRQRKAQRILEGVV